MKQLYLIAIFISIFTNGMLGQGMGAGEEEFNFPPNLLKSKGIIQCKVYTSSASEELPLDSFNIKKEFDFDNMGNIIKETNYDSKIKYKHLYINDRLAETQVIAMENSLIERLIYQYNRKGKETSLKTINDKGRETSTITSIYKRKLLKEETYFIDKTERTYWKYAHNKKKQIVERKTYTDGYFNGVWKYAYDANGNLTHFTIFDKDNKLVTKHIKHYNSKNQIIKIEVFSNKNQLISVINAKYDNSGLLQERVYIYNIFNENLNEAEKEIEKYKYYKTRGN